MAGATLSMGGLPWGSALAAALALPGVAHATGNRSEGFGDLPPPPPRSAEPAAGQRLELELFVNGLRTGIVAPVFQHGPRFQLRPDDLRRAGLLIGAAGDAIFLDSLEGLRADYDAPRQQLHLTVSPEYLPSQHLGGPKRKFERAKYDVGGLLNYDVYVSGGEAPAQASVWHEARLFGPAGTFSTSGALRVGKGKTYVRFDTYWRWSDEQSMTTIEAGDFVTRSLPWAAAVRLGGVQVSRDFSVRPDVVTYPLPEFAGSAALPSTVELIVNGQHIAGGNVNPGPFALDTLPPINGYGEANLIVTDMHGRSVATSMPFYVSSTLLRPGLTDYSAAFGAFRRNYGFANFDYGELAGSASARHGVTDALTLEVRGEIADDMRLAGGGAVVKLGTFGTLNASYSRSFRDGPDGGQLTFGYDYQARGFSIGFRHSRQDSDYIDLGSLDRDARDGWERLTAATMSLSLGTAGTLGIGYFDIRQRGEDARLANLAWSLPLWRDGQLHASLSREFVDREWSGALTMTMSLGGRGDTVSGSFIQNQDGRSSLRADYTRPVPVEGGLGWSASALSDGGGSPYLRGDMTWRTQPVQLRAGVYGKDRLNGWFGASGSLVFMDGAVFAANRVTDAFAVVSTNGEAGIPVRYENQLIGRTNSHGQLLVPSASAYYPALYDINPLSLAANVKTPVVSQRVAIASGSGHVIRFPVERTVAARATILDSEGKPVPVGALATINGDATTYIGWDGFLFIENVAADNRVEISLPNAGRCHVTFAVKKMTEEMINLGDLTCRP